jgi:hypothetical protein
VAHALVRRHVEHRGDHLKRAHPEAPASKRNTVLKMGTQSFQHLDLLHY